jgi:SAM-dependent methyltransferase
VRSSAPDGGTSFGAQAALYARLRPSYPVSVFRAIEGALAGPRRRAVDLGAGNGQATKALARLFEEVTAVEPDARMAAGLPKIVNVRVESRAAENAAFADGSIDAVIAATSFHWMDQRKVVANVHRWLRAGGVFFPFLYDAFNVEGAAKSVYEKHSALWEPYRDRRLKENVDYRKVFAETGVFSNWTPFADSIEARLSAGEAAGLLGTTSFGGAYARAAFGDPALYIAELAGEFRACGEPLIVRAPLNGVLAVKAF